MRFLSAGELWRVADAVADRDRALVLLLGLCGPRIGEAAALTLEDLDLLRRTLKITKAVSEVAGRVMVGAPKTGTSRAVPLPCAVVEALAAHLGAFPVGRGGLVFPDRDGGPIGVGAYGFLL
jgi:integrase